MALTKQAISEKIREQMTLPKKQSNEVTETLLELIKSSLDSGEDVLVSGFGKFRTIKKADRKERNPGAGKDTIIPARRVVTFKYSRKLGEKINSG